MKIKKNNTYSVHTLAVKGTKAQHASNQVYKLNENVFNKFEIKKKYSSNRNRQCTKQDKNC